MLAAQSGPSPLTVGRDAELERLRRHFTAVGAADDHPPVAVVSGEAGVGKTRLVRELSQSLVVPVLVGQPDEGRPPTPFSVVRGALESIVTRWAALPAGLAGWEHRVSHVLGRLPPGHPSAADHEHTAGELARAGVELFRVILDGRPALVVFEDLHAADAESIAVLTRLAATRGLPALLVATFRPDGVHRRHPLTEALRRLDRRQGVLDLVVDRLGPQELGRMLEATFGEPLPDQAVGPLHARTGGNPFFVEQVVAGMVGTEAAQLGDTSLPWNVFEAVLRRLDRLDPRARAVLDAASLLGTPVPLALLASVLGTGEAELFDDLRGLVRRGLLVEVASDAFAFGHSLTREAVAGELPGHEQRRIQAAALAWLEDRGSSNAVELAYRAAAARQPAKLVAYAWEGAQWSLQHGSAVRALDVAELALDEASPREGRDAVRLHRVATQAAAALGLSGPARGHADAWLAAARRLGDVAEQSAALRHVAKVCQRGGDDHGLRAALDAAFDVARPLGASAELARVLSCRAGAELRTGSPEEAERWAGRSLEVAATAAAPQARATALLAKGTALTRIRGREDEGMASLRAGRVEARRLGDAVTLLRGYRLALEYLLHERPGSSPQSRVLHAEAEAAADRYGHEEASHTIARAGFRLAVIEGDLEEAEARLAYTVSGGPYAAPETALHRCALALERDDRADAGRLIEQASRQLGVAVAANEGADRLLPLLLRQRVALAARAGDRALAESCLRALARIPVTGDDRERASLGCGAVADGARAGCDPELLEAVVAWARRAADVTRPTLAADVAHALASIAARRGEFDTAAGHYRDALAVPGLPRPAVQVADAEMGLARCLADLGDASGAREHARRACDVLERWPGWRRDRAASLMSRLSRWARHPEALLSPRERQVLALLARGLSNRQIAEELLIARKTAAVHVSNILAKTGTRSRAQAAEWARERRTSVDAH